MSEIDRTRVRGREDLAAFADGLLAAVEPYRSPAGSLITLPGSPGGYGTAVDGLEGFARTFLLAGFRVTGERGADPNHLLERYARGFAAGTDPHGSERWVRPTEHPQAKVEAASLALILDMTRPWLWNHLDPVVQEQIVDYLAEVVGDDTYPRCNWLWFRVSVETFLRSVGGPHRLDDIRADLALHDEFYEQDGWYRDGDERSYDHYIGWAMHLFPTLWAQMSGAADLAKPRATLDAERLDRFLADAVHLVGTDGTPLIQGRSLIYRFAAAAPYWVGALAQVPSVPLGQLRRAALGMVDHFAQHVPNDRGLLDLGWHRPWRALAQSYSGTGSPYWASKGLLGLALPADHPVWSAPEEELPHESADVVRSIAAPGWVVSGTAADGVVRVSNHGTDHALAGSTGGDSPLYARLGYSTATFPLLDAASWQAPRDQSVVLTDAAGRRSHRSGMLTLPVDNTASTTAIAASRARAHWIRPADEQQLHGSGAQGEATDAGTITTISVLHGAWEVRLVHLDDPSPDATALEAGGWALADDSGVVDEQTNGAGSDNSASAVGTTLVTRTHSAGLHGLRGWTSVRTDHHDDASPLGAHACVAILTSSPTPGWYALALGLAGIGRLPAIPSVHIDAGHARIEWADGTGTAVILDNIVDRADGGPSDSSTTTPIRARDLEERITQ
ncbi:DUF2264 domain-containing protein [Ruania halotolerans]|uniref:DUF2264 domain-containing protein n=1 Tax=Ruania halotolerans TaxID=2897773 RepID=UPI001E504248|nr:DUF2264 domain-containing protein [Ruania halotolerans]UFU06774.1 DUF2264 domain-containing protein [Ruania halotolerans]